jgi:hypothetical protein
MEQVPDVEQAIVVPCRTKMSYVTRRVLTGTLLSFFLCLAAFSPAGAVEHDSAFERSGIHYPGGFDPNTVGELQGKVSGIHRPASRNGPVMFDLETTWEKYTVIVCPPWYWDELKTKVSVGEEVRVIGSKSLGKDSNLYIVAQEIYFVGQGKSVIMLRDKTGTPIWDAHRGKTGPQQGSGGRIRGQRE